MKRLVLSEREFAAVVDKYGITKDQNAPVHGYPFGIRFPYSNMVNNSHYMLAREAFAAAWDAKHGVGAWDRNDWVWVYSLGKLERRASI
jgi:hypothetical protein